ncbi:Gfo/Idh/MocA family oxidoreductase [Bacillaceae bacterium S4-13-58]
MKIIGLVGLGFIGKAHLEAYQNVKNADVVSILTRREVKDEDVLQTFRGSFVHDYDLLLNNPEIDVIDICLPTYLHEEYIVKAAKAGKHIICEKPLTLTIESAERIVREVEKHQVELFVGHVLRFWPEYQVMKEYSQNGKLKDIEMVQAKRLGQVPQWSNWFQYPEKSGGALFDLHIHDIDYLTYLLGEVTSIYAVGSQNSFGAWDHIMTTLQFGNGAKACVEASQRMPLGYPFTMALRAQTRNSALDFLVVAGENIENINESEEQLVYYHQKNKTTIEVKKADAFMKELSYFVCCLENHEENTIVPLEDVLYTLKLLKAIETSLETGEKVRV